MANVKKSFFKHLQGPFSLLFPLAQVCTHRHVNQTAAPFYLFSLGWTEGIVEGGQMCWVKYTVNNLDLD